jgi:hypothetical protein
VVLLSTLSRTQKQLKPTMPRPPSDAEKNVYLGLQHRWLQPVQLLAYSGVGVSLYGFSTLVNHRAVVALWSPDSYPSVDVLLPSAGEPLDLLSNTYSHVAALQWPGRLRTYVLDDSARPEVEALAADYGFTYLVRPTREFKKAGNLRHGFESSDGDFITIFDADFVPRTDFLAELVPYFDTPNVGIVQSPQHFATDRSLGWLERTAGATQELFYRFIQPARDAVGAAICVGTSAVYRRAALEAIDGFPQTNHSEDVVTGIEMAKVGYELQYVPTVVSTGTCPSGLNTFIAQLVAELISVREIHDGDVVVASRCCGQGGAEGLSSYWRHAVSPGSTLLARAMFPRRVACTDPMTEFFCLNRRSIDLGRLEPRGFKILLEERLTGTPKTSWRQRDAFLVQLAGLRLHWPQTRSMAIPLHEPVCEGGWPARHVGAHALRRPALRSATNSWRPSRWINTSPATGTSGRRSGSRGARRRGLWSPRNPGHTPPLPNPIHLESRFIKQLRGGNGRNSGYHRGNAQRRTGRSPGPPRCSSAGTAPQPHRTTHRGGPDRGPGVPAFHSHQATTP